MKKRAWTKNSTREFIHGRLFNSPFGQKRQGNIAGLIAGPFHGLVTKAEKYKL